MTVRTWLPPVAAAVMVGMLGCAAEEPEGSGGGGGSCAEEGAGGAALACGQAPGGRTCTLPADWYAPGADDAWAACAASDDGTYDRIDPGVSTIARVAAFESIAGLLWRSGQTPGPQAFADAAFLYAAEEGLGSRVARREDLHYPEPSSGKCTDEGVPARFPDRCVGPARLAPLIADAFERGQSCDAPEVQAARLEAALLFFFYVSSHKEATTCATTAKDCDSAWAYYNGGSPSDAPLGLAAYVDGVDPATHLATEHGILAVRCWRELDPAVPAEDLEMQGRALAQLDAGLTRGILLIARERFQILSCNTGSHRQAAYAFLGTLLPLLDRAARAIDPAAADTLKAQLEGGPDGVDVEAAVEALDTLYERCD